MAGDIQLTCSDCGQDFTFTAADQAFFQERGYSTRSVARLAVRQRKTTRGLRLPFGSGTGNTCDLFGLRPAYNSSFRTSW